MITITGLEKHYGGQVLFSGVDLQLHDGARYGIVGANGAGKSTLLRIISGEESASSGDVQLPRKARIGVLEQDHFAYEDTPIIEVVMQGAEELWADMQAKERMLDAADAGGDFDADRFAALEERILQRGGYELEARAAEILDGLNIPTDRHREPLRVLSGGYKLRALLAKLLVGRPEILLLDEPTNHLDILSVDWLERFLAAYKGCVLVVSHDHRFLDNVCSHILDVDYETILTYKGNYSRFVKAKVEERARREQEIEKRKGMIEDQKAFIARFKAKATKARQANSRAKQLARIEIETLPESSRRHPLFRFPPQRHSGREVLAVKELWKAYGDDLVLGDVSFKVHRGERVAIIGPNGIGKSTLLKIATGRLEADEGEVKWGYETHVGYFAQDHHEILTKPEATLKSWLWDHAPGQSVGFVHGKLAEVLFAQEEVDKKLENLSGGEAARLVFATLGVKQPNVLVLDEPTNHLDLEGIESLAKGLEDFDGTVIFVSHDRWFVSRLATRVLDITADGVEDFHGSYEEFLDRKNQDRLDAEAVKAAEREAKRKSAAKKTAGKKTAGKKTAGKKTASAPKSSSGKKGASKTKSGAPAPGGAQKRSKGGRRRR
jgi:ATPase subunit of ABC transporter with duplicated ATPase domains